MRGMRFSPLLAIFFLISCTFPSHYPVNPANNLPPDRSEKVSIFGSKESQLPPVVSPSQYPIHRFYHIRTRIVIEFYHLRGGNSPLEDDEIGENNNREMTFYGSEASHVYLELKNAEAVFRDVGLKFDIEEIAFKPANVQWQKYFDDAKSHPDFMSIYCMLPNTCPMAGISSFPWYERKYGIVLAPNRSDWSLAHEIGHYFGLLHTFDEDYCDDTPPQRIPCMAFSEKCPFPIPPGETDENCCNLMDWCVHTPKYVTPDQIERMRRYIRTMRRECIIEEPHDRFLELINIMESINSYNEARNEDTNTFTDLTKTPTTKTPTTTSCPAE